MKSAIAAFAAAIALLACASGTQFVNTRKAPDAGPVSFAGKKVAAFVLGVNEPTRRTAEDVLARELSARGAQGVAGHSVVSATELRDREAAKAKLRAAGFEGVVLLRLVDAQRKAVHTEWAGDAYRRMPQIEAWGRGGMDPGFERSSLTVSVETAIYSLAEDRLLWSGLSQTTEAAQAQRFIFEHATAVAEELRREGLVR